MNDKKQIIAKVVLAGASGVGKTAIVSRYCKGAFGSDADTTIGANYLRQQVETLKRTVVFEIWDTAGQEVYQSLTATFFKEANAIILVYDITNKSSLKGLDVYVKQIRSTCSKKTVIAVVGNKTDLESRRQIRVEEGWKYAESIGSPIFLETSALTGENVRIIFESIADADNLTFKDDNDILSNEAKQNLEDRNCNC